jgi:2,5-diketo-D-gluconate reductase B
MGARRQIPLLGLGTYPLRSEDAYNAVRMAIDAGIRHIDTAQMYGNEAEVGRGVRDCGLPREELFVVTKVDPGNTMPARFDPSVQRSMSALGGPADLLLIHWPPAADGFETALEHLMKARDEGAARQIGVSNFSPGMMRRAHALTKGAIVNNQVEFHPLLDQRALLAEARALGITLSAFSPIARGAALKLEPVQAIAQRIGRPPSEVALRWIIQQGVAAIPMTTKRENARSNLKALEFALAQEDMDAISALGTRGGRLINPSWMSGRWDE